MKRTSKGENSRHTAPRPRTPPVVSGSPPPVPVVDPDDLASVPWEIKFVDPRPGQDFAGEDEMVEYFADLAFDLWLLGRPVPRSTPEDPPAPAGKGVV